MFSPRRRLLGQRQENKRSRGQVAQVLLQGRAAAEARPATDRNRQCRRNRREWLQQSRLVLSRCKSSALGEENRWGGRVKEEKKRQRRDQRARNPVPCSPPKLPPPVNPLCATGALCRWGATSLLRYCLLKLAWALTTLWLPRTAVARSSQLLLPRATCSHRPTRRQSHRTMCHGRQTHSAEAIHIPVRYCVAAT